MMKNSKEKEQYSQNAEVRQRKLGYIRTRDQQDKRFCSKQKSYFTQRCQTDHEFKKKNRSRFSRRYRTDECFTMRRRAYITERYRDDVGFKNRQRSYITERYRDDVGFKNRQRSYITERYRDDVGFRNRQRYYITRRYLNNPEFRFKHQEIMRRIMKTKSDSLRTKTIRRVSTLLQKYKVINQLCRERNDCVIMKAVELFKAQIKNGPTFVCTVCHRALFPNQVRPCRRSFYKKNRHVVASCLTGQFVHICDDECQASCSVPAERKLEWICHTCCPHLKDGKMPAFAVANNLTLSDIPKELCGLNILERHLISKCISFAKIVPLPKGQQRAIRGNVVCVPSEVQETVNVLPRLRIQKHNYSRRCGPLRPNPH
ncbi:uncharacterized protein LOC119137893 [Syngnathus acus]|uniref:uncharacterized protein LOC119137892 n=1 Tax=Syngnathus acus TaxID=161584 RepID=UPI001885DD8D|nr:uncharacterized protein LOC119137892 [Syngnathus acus]XP_037133390.1 uncharacterized protein LOC119137893 [Syngnathus acus]